MTFQIYQEIGLALVVVSLFLYIVSYFER